MRALICFDIIISTFSRRNISPNILAIQNTLKIYIQYKIINDMTVDHNNNKINFH